MNDFARDCLHLYNRHLKICCSKPYMSEVENTIIKKSKYHFLGSKCRKYYRLYDRERFNVLCPNVSTMASVDIVLHYIEQRAMLRGGLSTDQRNSPGYCDGCKYFSTVPLSSMRGKKLGLQWSSWLYCAWRREVLRESEELCCKCDSLVHGNWKQFQVGLSSPIFPIRPFWGFWSSWNNFI